MAFRTQDICDCALWTPQKVVKAWQTAKIQSDAEMQVDAVSNAQCEPGWMLKDDWTDLHLSTLKRSTVLHDCDFQANRTLNVSRRNWLICFDHHRHEFCESRDAGSQQSMTAAPSVEI